METLRNVIRGSVDEEKGWDANQRGSKNGTMTFLSINEVSSNIPGRIIAVIIVGTCYRSRKSVLERWRFLIVSAEDNGERG